MARPTGSAPTEILDSTAWVLGENTITWSLPASVIYKNSRLLSYTDRWAEVPGPKSVIQYSGVSSITPFPISRFVTVPSSLEKVTLSIVIPASVGEKRKLDKYMEPHWMLSAVVTVQLVERITTRKQATVMGACHPEWPPHRLRSGNPRHLVLAGAK